MFPRPQFLSPTSPCRMPRPRLRSISVLHAFLTTPAARRAGHISRTAENHLFAEVWVSCSPMTHAPALQVLTAAAMPAWYTALVHRFALDDHHKLLTKEKKGANLGESSLSAMLTAPRKTPCRTKVRV